MKEQLMFAAMVVISMSSPLYLNDLFKMASESYIWFAVTVAVTFTIIITAAIFLSFITGVDNE